MGPTTLAVLSPVDGTLVGHVPQTPVESLDEVFDRARLVQAEWATTSLEDRQRRLLRFHDLVMRHREAIIDLIVSESGKARKDAFQELMHVAITARYYARRGARQVATRRRAGVLPLLTRVEVNHLPKGVVGVISPWNYPLTMAMSDGLAALVAGNAVVAKPDAQTTLTAQYAVRLLEEAGFPQGLWQVVAGEGAVIGTAIVDRADYVCFTGSTATGRLIAERCAKRLIGNSLELGGKNPMLVLADADLAGAVEGAVRGTFSNAGQLCVSIERIFVADSVYDAFRDAFVARTAALTIGDPRSWKTDVGTLISEAQLARVTAHVEDAVAKGAVLATGGKARPDLGRLFHEPTILEGVTPAMDLYAEETFGPVVSLYRVADDDAAVKGANEGDYGLNASIYSTDTTRARALARRVKAGSVNINEAYAATFGSIDAPMGGMRASGMGRRQGPEGILRFTEPQTVATQRLMPIAPSYGLSEEQFAKLTVASEHLLRLLRRA